MRRGKRVGAAGRGKKRASGASKKGAGRKPAKKKRGRPPRLDINRQRALCALIEQGHSDRRAAREVGCAPNTIRNTSQRDKRFRMLLDKARDTRERWRTSLIFHLIREGIPLELWPLVFGK
jgi:hypothetical protein